MHRIMYRSPLLVLMLVPALVALAIYAPTLQYGKIWDDWILLNDFTNYGDPEVRRRILTSPLPFSDNYYRPLVMLTFIWQRYLELSDFASHLINIVIHGLNSCLLALIGWKLWPATGNEKLRRIAMTGIGVIYALHPAITEGVVWIAGRFDLMVTTFMLLAILADIAIRSRFFKASIIGALFLAALFCKEMAITLPLLLLLLNMGTAAEAEYKRIFRGERVIVYIAMTITLLIYLSVRYSVLGYILTPDPAMAFIDLGTPLQRLLLVGAAFWGYLVTMLMPLAGIKPLHYAALPIPITDIPAWSGLIALVCLALACLIYIRRPSTRFAAACSAAAVVSLLPVLHINPVPMLLANTLTADRAAIMPLVFLLLGLSQFISHLETRKQFVAVSLICTTWIFLSALIVRAILPLWQSDYMLWKWLSEDTPACSYCRANYARLMVLAGPPEPALNEARIAISLAAQPWQAAMALGVEAMALRKLGRMDEAISAAAKAEEAEPVVRAKMNYMLQQSSMLIESGRFDEAGAVLKKVTSLGGGSRLDTLVQIGDLALATGRPDIARTVYNTAYSGSTQEIRNIKMTKTDVPEKWARLGDFLTARKEYAAAAEAYKEARRLDEINSAKADKNQLPSR